MIERRILICLTTPYQQGCVFIELERQIRSFWSTIEIDRYQSFISENKPDCVKLENWNGNYLFLLC